MYLRYVLYQAALTASPILRTRNAQKPSTRFLSLPCSQSSVIVTSCSFAFAGGDRALRPASVVITRIRARNNGVVEDSPGPFRRAARVQLIARGATTRAVPPVFSSGPASTPAARSAASTISLIVVNRKTIPVRSRRCLRTRWFWRAGEERPWRRTLRHARMEPARRPHRLHQAVGRLQDRGHEPQRRQ